MRIFQTSLKGNCYPAGSMTGAPKKEVIQFIEGIENFSRGLYAGNIGYFSPNGDFDFNVVIRSLVL
jgi:para-aminobenzoate synthetase component 1